MNKIKDLFLYTDPLIITRSVLPYQAVGDKNTKQFITTKDTYLVITFADSTSLTLFANSGYKFDGATIPFNIGKGDMRLQIPALFHDITCDDKDLVNFDRKLSSLIFKELLRACGFGKFSSFAMYFCVDNYQRIWRNWEK